MKQTPRKHAAVAAVLLLFALAAAVRTFSSPGDDLSASYLGCRVLADGEPAHLYSRDPTRFERVDDPVWVRLAREAGFHSLREFHPYVQTPLWAAVLRPVCTRVSFPMFNRIFRVLTLGSFAGLLWFVAYRWMPRLYHPGWMALLCAGLYLTEPFKYATHLTQTHILFLLPTVVALGLARTRPVWAGALLAAAAAVKITPGLLFLYWLTAGRFRTAWSFFAASVVLVGLTLGTAGLPLFSSYLHELGAVGNTLLVSFNNQSLAAWALGSGAGSAELYAWHIHPLPAWMKGLGLLLSAAAAVWGGWLDRASCGKSEPHAPIGAFFALVGATVCTPIAWTHYLIVLLLPAMAMLDAYRRRRSPVLLCVVAAVFLLLLDPSVGRGALGMLPWFGLVRRGFYAALLSLAGLVLVDRMERASRVPDGVRNQDTPGSGVRG